MLLVEDITPAVTIQQFSNFAGLCRVSNAASWEKSLAPPSKYFATISAAS